MPLRTILERVQADAAHLAATPGHAHRVRDPPHRKDEMKDVGAATAALSLRVRAKGCNRRQRTTYRALTSAQYQTTDPEDVRTWLRGLHEQPPCNQDAIMSRGELLRPFAKCKLDS